MPLETPPQPLQCSLLTTQATLRAPQWDLKVKPNTSVNVGDITNSTQAPVCMAFFQRDWALRVTTVLLGL